MKKKILLFLALLAAPACFAQNVNIASVSTTPVSIVTNVAASSITIRENAASGTDTTVFVIQDNSNGTSTNTITIPAGQSYTFFQQSGVQFPSGTTLGTVATVSGTTTFVLIQSNAPSTTIRGTSIVAPSNSSASGTVTGVNGTANQIDCTNSPTAPTCSLDPAIILPGSLTVPTGGSIGVTGSGTNIATMVPFAGVTGGTPNTTATLTIGSGASLSHSGTGTISATSALAVPSSGVTGKPIFTVSDTAPCDGSTDYTTAIQAVFTLASATANLGGAVIQGPGKGLGCVISSPLVLAPAAGNTVGIKSITIQNLSLIWNGANGGSTANPISIQNCQGCTFKDSFITTSSPSAHAIGSAVTILQQASLGTSSGNVFQNIQIEGISGSGLNVGFELAQGSAGNANNDEMVFTGNEVRNYTAAGFLIDHNQSTDHTFYGNKCYSVAAAASSVCLDDTTGAAVEWHGGYANGDTNVDFVSNSNTAHPVLIEGANSEGSNRFFLGSPAGGTGSENPVTLLNDRFSTNALNADGHCVIVNNPGPLNIIGGSYGQNQSNVCNFYWAPDQSTYHVIYGEIKGVSMSAASSSTTNPLAFAGGITRINVVVDGNTYSDATGHTIVASGFTEPGTSLTNISSAIANTSIPTATYNTSLNGTSNSVFTLENTTVSTNGVNNLPMQLQFLGTYYTGAASANDTWLFQPTYSASANNPVSTLSITHAGSSGTPLVLITPATTISGSVNANGTSFNTSGSTTSHFSGSKVNILTNGTITATACTAATSAGAVACGANIIGSVGVPTGTNPTLVVNTTAVTAASQIFLTSDDSATVTSTTCNTTLATITVTPAVTARTAGTSFTITVPAVVATYPVCVNYWVVN
jgi:hypothetical protein